MGDVEKFDNFILAVAERFSPYNVQTEEEELQMYNAIGVAFNAIGQQVHNEFLLHRMQAVLNFIWSPIEITG